MRVHNTNFMAISAAFALISLSPESCFGQRLTWMDCHAIVTGRFLGEQLSELASSYGQARASGAQMRAQIALARRDFWETFPDKGGHAEARNRLAKKLVLRDQINAVGGIGAGPYSPARDMSKYLFGAIDDPIPSFAREAHDEWIMGLREQFGVTYHGRPYGSLNQRSGPMVFVRGPQHFKAAMKGAQALYLRYRLRRDWNDFREAGKEAAFYASPEGFLSYWLWEDRDSRLSAKALERPPSVASAEAVMGRIEGDLEQLLQLYGRDSLHEAAQALIGAEKKPDGRLVSPERAVHGARSADVLTALRELLSRTTGRAAVASLLWESEIANQPTVDLNRIRRRREVLYALMGRQAAEDAALRVSGGESSADLGTAYYAALRSSSIPPRSDATTVAWASRALGLTAPPKSPEALLRAAVGLREPAVRPRPSAIKPVARLGRGRRRDS